MEQLTTTNVRSEEEFRRQFVALKSIPNTYFVVVAEDIKLNQIVGAASVIIELKFVHSCSKVKYFSFLASNCRLVILKMS